MGRLTTHVLDTSLGRPARALRIELFRLAPPAAPVLIASLVTNDDGRLDQPLLAGEAVTAGSYELVFHAGDYLRAVGAAITEPPFLDIIPLRFQISDPAAHYHVPLLLSAFGYSTYRGS